MDPEEQRIADEEARIAALAGGGGDPPAPDDEMSSSTVPEDEDPDVPSEEALRAANDAANPDPDAPAPEPDPDAEPEPDAPPPGRDTFRERIGQLSADKRTLKQQLADARAENERLRAGQTDPAADPPANPDPAAPQRRQFASEADFNAAVTAEATRRAATQAFNDKCNTVEERGAKAFGAKWAAAKDALALLDDDGTIPFDLLTPALETDNPHRVILALGEDPDLAARLLRMNPVRRAMEIARMDTATPPTPPKRSEAPPPVDTIRGRPPVGSSSTAPSDRDSDADWLRKRNAQIKAREAARG